MGIAASAAYVAGMGIDDGAATVLRPNSQEFFDATVLVIAKTPVAGRAKTRLSPPCAPSEAAALAEAALIDTLQVVAQMPVRRRCVVLEGTPGAWLPAGFDVVPQSGGALGQRLASAFGAVQGPALLVGMDTPQLDRELLATALSALTGGRFDAVLGPTVDGGYWTIGLREPRPEVFEGVPMSTSRTYAAQLERLLALGLRIYRHRTLRDVDYFADAEVVARLAPESAFATAVARLG
jgi:rSAM/selenodomain-associated transferase 1